MSRVVTLTFVSETATLEERAKVLERIASIAEADTACGCCRSNEGRERATEQYWLLKELKVIDGGPCCPTPGCLREPHLDDLVSRCEPEDAVEAARKR